MTTSVVRCDNGRNFDPTIIQIDTSPFVNYLFFTGIVCHRMVR